MQNANNILNFNSSNLKLFPQSYLQTISSTFHQNP
nr:MAG TPA: hypothetical protein [Caudoviricetes sp.]